MRTGTRNLKQSAKRSSIRPVHTKVTQQKSGATTKQFVTGGLLAASAGFMALKAAKRYKQNDCSYRDPLFETVCGIKNDLDFTGLTGVLTYNLEADKDSYSLSMQEAMKKDELSNTGFVYTYQIITYVDNTLDSTPDECIIVTHTNIGPRALAEFLNEFKDDHLFEDYQFKGICKRKKAHDGSICDKKIEWGATTKRKFRETLESDKPLNEPGILSQYTSYFFQTENSNTTQQNTPSPKSFSP